MASLRGSRSRNVQGRRGDRNCAGDKSPLTSTNRGEKVQPGCPGDRPYKTTGKWYHLKT